MIKMQQAINMFYHPEPRDESDNDDNFILPLHCRRVLFANTQPCSCEIRTHGRTRTVIMKRFPDPLVRQSVAIPAPVHKKKLFPFARLKTPLL